jgi:hypothetical protein
MRHGRCKKARCAAGAARRASAPERRGRLRLASQQRVEERQAPAAALARLVHVEVEEAAWRHLPQRGARVARGGQVQPLAPRFRDAQHAHAHVLRLRVLRVLLWPRHVALRRDVERVVVRRHARVVGDGRAQRLRGRRQPAGEVHHAAHDGRLRGRQRGCARGQRA